MTEAVSEWRHCREPSPVELSWRHKDMRLLARGENDYEWVPGDDPRLTTPTRLRFVGGVGETRDDGPQGRLVAGDALDTLQALAHDPIVEAPGSGGVRLAYIDPPFNRGQRFAHYGDSLDQSMWLSMLRDRLTALRPLLAPTGSVWVHLDDAEMHHGRCVLDEVFGSDAFVATVVWQTRTTRESRSAFSSNHDYIHVYAPCGPKMWKRSRNLLPKGTSAFRNRDDDPRGPWTDAPFTAPGFRANQQYPIVNPAGLTLKPPRGRSWYATEAVYQELLRENRIWFPREGAGLPRLKLFPHHVRGLVPFSLWGTEECGTNDDAKRHLISLFPGHEPFATPKPEPLLQRIIHIASDPGDVVLDFFAGSGTTAAVAHKMGRHWIAVERSRATVATYALPRLRKVVEGRDPGGITGAVKWSGGGSFSLLEAEDPSMPASPEWSALSTPEDLAGGSQAASAYGVA